MSSLPPPPKTYLHFTKQFPLLEEAWESMGKAGQEGPLDERTARLVKLGVAVGAMREGAVHASVRKAKALGISEEEINQVIALAASLLGMPSTVAAFTWTRDILDGEVESPTD